MYHLLTHGIWIVTDDLESNFMNKIFSDWCSDGEIDVWNVRGGPKAGFAVVTATTSKYRQNKLMKILKDIRKFYEAYIPVSDHILKKIWKHQGISYSLYLCQFYMNLSLIGRMLYLLDN